MPILKANEFTVILVYNTINGKCLVMSDGFLHVSQNALYGGIPISQAYIFT